MKAGLLALLLAPPLLAQQAQAPKAPLLDPGEALAVGIGERQTFYGETDREYPMGSLAKLIWLHAEGPEWMARDLRFKCTGDLEGVPCTKKGGHGRLDLGKGLQEGCDLAFLAWGRWSVHRWTEESGEESACIRAQEAFRPFLGDRMPKAGALTLDRGWVGEGQILRASPKSMLGWFVDPMNEGFNEQAMRVLRPLGSLLSRQGQDWWVYAAGAWVVGSNGRDYAVLRLPEARERAEGQARFRTLLGIR